MPLKSAARRAVVALMLLVAASVWSVPAVANDLRTVVAKAKFEDVKFEINNAIVNRGFVIEGTGRVGEMLTRTGKDVGSDKPIYRQAEYVTFCSAKLSRQMMEADPANVAYCPYVIFYYETVARPGEVVVGYRAPGPRSDDKSKAAFAAIVALLDAIIKEAVR